MTTDEKGKSHVLAASIFGAALIASATAIWVTLRLTDRPESAARESTDVSGPTPSDDGAVRSRTSTASAATAAHPGAAEPQPLSQEVFSAAWDGPLRQQAERACFVPHSSSGRETESSPFFTVVVGEDGRIERVTYPDEAKERFGNLFPCVAELVEQMQLPAGPRRTGRVQAARPQP